MTDRHYEDRMVRLRWACRRTLQALDAPLGNFLKDCYSNLDMAGQFAFERLLNARDQDILDWLAGHKKPNDLGLISIIHAIQTHHNKSTLGN